MKRAALLATAFLLAGGAGGWADSTKRDAVRILAVTPDWPLERGVETDLTIDVEVDLQSAEERVSMVGFNLESPARFVMKDSRKLVPGAQRSSFVAKVVPVDWGVRADFQVMVTVGPKDETARWKPTASVKNTIEVTP